MKKLRLDFFKEALTREQMKRFIGGSEGGSNPDSPINTGGPDKRARKCCWRGTDNCSKCVEVTSNATCAKGAVLTDC